MASYFKPNRFSLFPVFVVFLIAACNNPGSNTNKKSISPSTKNFSPNETLYKLFTDSANIVTLDTFKVVFVPRFTPGGVLELDGWSAKKDTVFQVGPNITLSSYDTSNVPFGSGMYTGNIVLKKKELANVKAALNTRHMHYVIFIPQIINSTHFGYIVQLTNDNPSDESRKVVPATPPVGSMNPSPPKTY
jgi:hypothetical protein